MQSGVGWNEREFKLEAEPRLWENLGISFGTKFLKFKKKRFPLYDTLGDLYHRHIAEGHFNFTSTAEQPLKPNVKKCSADGLVGVMERFVKIQEKEANHEAMQNFTITKCIAELRNLEGFDPAQKPRAFAVFKSEENREIFVNAVGDKDGSALAWLQMEMDK